MASSYNLETPLWSHRSPSPDSPHATNAPVFWDEPSLRVMNQIISSWLPRLLPPGARLSRHASKQTAEKRRVDQCDIPVSKCLRQRRLYTIDIFRSGARQSAPEEAEEEGLSRLATASQRQQAAAPNRSPSSFTSLADLVGLPDPAAAVENEEEQVVVSPELRKQSRDSEYAALLDLDYAKSWPLALSRQEPDLSIRCIVAANRANDHQFLQSVSDTDFSAMINLLQPANFLSELIDVHYHMKDAMVRNYMLTPLQKIAEDYGSAIGRLMDIRRSSGLKLSIPDYEIILNASKELRLKELAERAWQMLGADGHLPTTKCYNGYIGASFWLSPLSAQTRHRDRATPYNLKWRSVDNLRSYFSFRIGETGSIDGIGDRLFAEMREQGLKPDEESYCNMIVAAGLEGRTNSVAAILKNVWNIDIHTEDSIDAVPRRLAHDDPLHPTKRLLFDVTRAYCINSDPRSALKLLEYICRHYHISVDEKQWALLLEWTHVLSVPRQSWETGVGRAKGKLDVVSMKALWHTMTRPPYNVAPGVEMFNLLIRNLNAQQEEHGVLKAMEKGRMLHEEELVQRHKKWLALTRAVKLNGKYEGSAPEDSIEHTTRNWELACLKCTRDRDFLQTWLHFYLTKSERFALFDYDASRSAIEIPDMLWRWRWFVPRVVEYCTPTGHVELVFRTAEESASNKISKMKKAADRQTKLQNAGRLVDGTWIMNDDAPNRAKSTEFEHNNYTDVTKAGKRREYRRRPRGDELAAVSSQA